MGIAATNFATARTPENFRAWVQEAPAEAAQYLKTVAVKTANVATLNALDQLEQAAPQDPVAAFGDLFTQLDAAAMGAVQAARVDTLGWQANGTPREPPTVTGRLTMEGTTPVLTTPFGAFTVKSVNPVGVNDASAFAGRVVTVKGWPEGAWQPGADAARPTLLAEEFGPGTSGELVTGRVKVVNGEVFVDVRPDKQVKITDPALKEALAGFPALGIVLPGDPKREGDAWVYDHAPEGYYILAGFNNVKFNGNGPAEADGVMRFPLQLAHGKSLQAELPKAAWDASTRQQRHYFYGRIEGAAFKALAVTPTAGSWTGTPAYQRGTESTKFVAHTVPVEAPSWTPEESRFAP